MNTKTYGYEDETNGSGDTILVTLSEMYIAPEYLTFEVDNEHLDKVLFQCTGEVE